MKFKLFTGKNNQWYFSLLAANNKIIAQSEGYKSKRNALKTMSAMVEYFANCPDAVKIIEDNQTKYLNRE
jgi:uncharacterized protein YegP (UPF0339 family)